MNILIFAGAGISAESGLSTFRDKDGLWTKYDPMEVCYLPHFIKIKNDEIQRKKLFDFYNELKNSVDVAEPNQAHKEIYQWQQDFGVDRVKVVTSNVDDLFQKAGVQDVLQIHGNLESTHCIACQHTWKDDFFYYDKRCPKCNSRLTKPNIVFFGENAPHYSKMHKIFNYKKRYANDFILVIGTSFNVISAENLVQRKNAKTILLNKDITDDDHWFYHHFLGNATETIYSAGNIIKYYI